METGLCVTCGAEEVEVNDEGKCEVCGEKGEGTGTEGEEDAE